MQDRIGRLLDGQSANLSALGMKQRQQLGGSLPNVLMRLASGLSFGLPTGSGLRNGLIGSGFVLVPDGNARGFGLSVRLLDQPLFTSASGSCTVTTPSLRLRSTTPV